MKLTLRTLVEGAIMVAFAFVLSFIKLFSMPQGGSVTLVSMLPLIVYAMRRGPFAGSVACAVYGVLQFLQDGYALTPPAILLDYVLAFGVIGLAGFVAFKNVKVSVLVGTVLACVLRFLCHYVSGILFYASYAEEAGQAAWLYSLLYNGGFLSVELILTAAVGFLLAVRAPNLLKRQ